MAPGPVDDWSFVAEAEDVELTTAGGRRFRTVVAGPLVHDGDLYLHASTIFDLGDAALEEVLAGGGVRLLVDGKIYELAARRLTTAAEIDPVLLTLVRQNLKVEATGIRWDPEPARYPGTQIRQWFFRLESLPD
jgi:hypothetical protein